MKIIKKNKKGFTLLELMLSIAIITLLSGLLIILVISIKDSFMTVYNQNDSADQAILYGRAFEQAFLRDTCTSQTTKTFIYKMDNTTYKLLCNNKPVIEPKQSKTLNGTKDKWIIQMYFNYSDINKMVNYRIQMYDNYYNPGKLTYTYDGGFMIPHYTKKVLTSGNQKDGYFDIITINLT